MALSGVRLDNRPPVTTPIETERLVLLPFSSPCLRESLAGHRERAGSLLGCVFPPDWPGDMDDVLALRLSQLERDPGLADWLLRGVCLKSELRIVGTIGFHDAPGNEDVERVSPGAVEMGFEIEPAFRRQGIAREAALALMNWAHDRHGVRRFLASVRPDNLASLGLTAGLGFMRIGHHIDEIDGYEDIFEKVLGGNPDP